MRIGMFADMYTPHVSGVTNYIYLYKQALEDLGHEVWVFTFGDRSYDDLEPNVVRSPGIRWGDTGWRFGPGFSHAARDIAVELDVAHIHHPFLSGALTTRLCRQAGVPMVFTNHTRYDIYADIYAGWLPRKTRHALVYWWLRRFMAKTDRVLAPSPQIADWLRENRIAVDPQVLTNSVDVGAFAEPADPVSRDSLGFSDEDVVAVYLGRVGHEKDIRGLTKAFVAAAGRYAPLKMLVLGDGPALGEMRSEVDAAGLLARVHFAGMVPHSNAPDLLSVGDLFVTASTSETFPLVVIEAMAAGLPAIGVESPGVGEIIEDGSNGLVVDDASDLADAIVRIASDSGYRCRLAASAGEDAREHDVDARVIELLGHYEAARHAAG